MNVAIIGCGKIGQRRAKALRAEDHLVWACDTNIYKAYEVGAFQADIDWRPIIARQDVDAVIIATTPDVAPEIAGAAAAFGKHVLIEKPAAHCAKRLDSIMDSATPRGACVRVGFNHRYHRTIQKARELFDAGAIGDLMYIRGRYGHGGRLGYEKEWRADPKISGGGVLIDMGVHMIDLCGWFMGSVRIAHGTGLRAFWDCEVEDNAFLVLATEEPAAVAQLHVSNTEWKNLFSFEIFGERGKLEINGLGGSYGVESCTLYAMSPEMGPPTTTKWEYPMADDSWEREWLEFCEDIRLKRTSVPGIREAQAALRIVESVYEANR